MPSEPVENGSFAFGLSWYIEMNPLFYELAFAQGKLLCKRGVKIYKKQHLVAVVFIKTSPAGLPLKYVFTAGPVIMFMYKVLFLEMHSASFKGY